jgi:hypothetical protein
VHGPVNPALLGVLAGAVQRIDDPDPLGVEPARIVRRLLAEYLVVRAEHGETGHQQFVGESVARVLEGLRVAMAAPGALGEQGAPRLVCERPGQRLVVEFQASVRS